MQFNRKALIEAADKARVRHRALWEERVQAIIDAREADRKQWIERHRNDWLLACGNIVNKLQDGEPVVENDLPRERNYVAFYRPQPQRDTKYEEPHELKALIALLETVEDDTVSSSALKNLGFGQGTMSTVVGHLGAIKKEGA